MVEQPYDQVLRGQPDSSLVTYTHVIYGLHSLAVLIGLTGSVTIVGSFVCGIPSIVAVIMNYARRGDTYGTYLESHFRWQIRTFWLSLLWAILIGMIGGVLAIIGIGILIWIVGYLVLGVWIIYRVARGWMTLQDRRPMLIA